MVTAIDPERTFDYVLKEERGSENPTIFKLKVLTARELAEIEDSVSSFFSGKGEVELRIRPGTEILQILKRGLRGWENFKDDKGNNIPFRENNAVPREDNFDRIRPEWRRELANAITEMLTMSEEEEKN